MEKGALKGTMTANQKSMRVQAEYKNDVVAISVDYELDPDSGELRSINGTIQTLGDGQYAGNFSGSRNGDAMEYSMNGIRPVAFAETVADAVAEIEALIAEV